MKIFKLIRKPEFIYPLVSSILLGASRLPYIPGWLVFLGFIPLFQFFSIRSSFRSLVFAASTFAIGYTIVSLHWICLVTVPGFLGLFIIFSLYFLVLFYLINRFWQRFFRFKILSFIALWLSFEFLQNFGEFRFPWFNLGYSLAEYDILIQAADLGGIYLLTALILVVNYFVWRLRVSFWKNLLLLMITIIIWSGYGFYRLKTLQMTVSEKKIAMVQVSIPQKMKWEADYMDTTLQLYRTFTEKAALTDPDLIIWPESALPAYTLLSSTHRKFVRELAENSKADIFLGMPHYKYVGDSHPNKIEFYNAATLFEKNGMIQPYYVKNILVPFGERMPFLKYLPFLWNVHLGQANWEYGTRREFYRSADMTFSPLICFEIAFESLTTKMVKQNVDFIVNITNDAWFYRSAGTYQHAVMAKFRAVETRKSVFRCANTGYSLIVLPNGQISKKTELFERTIIADNLVLCNEKTIFTIYLSNWPYLMILVVLVFLIADLWITIFKEARK
jgi:apolipoprotein N-acyltransferase